MSFYETMFKIFPELNKETFLKKIKLIKLLKMKAPFYTYEDVKFRVIRDELLTPIAYKKIMFDLFNKYNFKYKNN